MSKQQLDIILEMSAQNPPPPGGPVEMRAWFEAMNAQTPIAEGAMIERVASGPTGGDLIRLPGGADRCLVIYFHGGGWMYSGIEAVDQLQQRLDRELLEIRQLKTKPAEPPRMI